MGRVVGGRSNEYNIAGQGQRRTAGAFIGDALGLGPHWSYDLAELKEDYGEWLDGYTDPQPDRYRAGLTAGE